tara:strand:+ start:1143 stop:2063 length:921 start_codon:yes stop_codon:yes gene_type:complete
MPLKLLRPVVFASLALILGLNVSLAQEKKKKVPAPFSWVNPLPESRAKWLPAGVRHAAFKSPSMGIEVGYFIYLPPSYEAEPETRFPVVYHLHGGRPGSEMKSVKLAGFVHDAVQKEEIQPTIYVFPNGGPMSWYNYPKTENGLGEDVFVKELIPHIDQTYRTRGNREGRALQGYSQGGRGTTRIMFKYPELWSSVAPGGSGYEPEKRIQENEGRESESIRFLPIGYNAWDLAKVYADKENKVPLKILFWVGTKGFNYEFNLKYMSYMDELGIPYEKLIVPGVAHTANGMYGAQGLELMKFHDRNF